MSLEKSCKDKYGTRVHDSTAVDISCASLDFHPLVVELQMAPFIHTQTKKATEKKA